MIGTIFIMLLAPITIAIGLLFLKNAYLTFLLYQGIYCVGIPIVDLVFIKKLKWNKIKTKIGLNVDMNSILFGFLYGALFFSAIMLFFIFLGNAIIDKGEISRLLQTWHIDKNQLFLFLFIMTFANSILEECFWRGYIIERMRSHTNIKIILIISAAFYASYHFITTINLFNLKIGLLFTTSIFIAGIFWGIIKEKCQSIMAPLISHFMADLAIMIIYLIYIHKLIDS